MREGSFVKSELRKNRQKRQTAAAGAALALALTLLPAVAGAQTKREDWQSGQWQFSVGLYLYLPTISGSTEFPGGTSGPSVSVDPNKILGSLNFVYMGTLEAENGRFGVVTDVIYMDVGGSKSRTRDITIGGAQLPAGTTADASLDMKTWVWTIAPELRVVSVPTFTMDVLLGARLLSVTQDLTWGVTGNLGSIPLEGRSGSLEVQETIWDGIVGIKGRIAPGCCERWILPYYFDVGTGGSDLTWQAAGGLGYAFRWGSISAGWRYLDYDLKSDSAVQSLTLSGPMLLAVYRW